MSRPLHSLATLRPARWLCAGLIAALPTLKLPEVTQLDLGSASLRGLPGVGVVAEETSQDARAQGLTQEWLETRVRGDLKARGIGVLERSDALTLPRRPLLVVRAQTVALPGSSIIAWHLSLAVHQNVRSPADSSTTVAAKTWEASSVIGATSARMLRASLGRTLGDQVGEFARVWATRDSSR